MKKFALIGTLTVVCGVANAIVLGQIDTFEDGTSMFWQGNGGGPPTNIPTDGPRGVDDNYLRIVSGDFPLPPHLATYNPITWTGDWLAAGVNVVEVHMRNQGEVPLQIRAVWFAPPTTRFTSTIAVPLPADGLWHKVAFPCRQGDLTRLQGSLTYTQAMTTSDRLLFRHQPGAPSGIIPNITSQMGLDNIEASNKFNVQPSNFVKIRGNESGGLQDLLFTDDLRMIWRPGIVFGTTQAPAVFTCDFFAPTLTNPSAMSFNIEGHASSASVNRQIELLNHNTGQFEVIVPFTPSAIADGLVTTPVANFADYIALTSGLIRSRISYKAFGPVFSYPWQGRIDQIFVRLTP